jgi:hypothetical protein
MAEVLGRAATEIAAGRKVLFDTQGRTSLAVCEMPTTWTAAASDTVATGVVIPKGARLLAPVTIANGTGTASQTLSVGLRNNLTKDAVDATALAATAAITTAACLQFNTGTKLTAGQRYVLVEDCEVYFTFSAHTPTANQAIRVEIPYMTP